MEELQTFLALKILIYFKITLVLLLLKIFSYCTTDLEIELSHGKKQSVTNKGKTCSSLRGI